METELPGTPHVNLLWTGGWDSTFQLLRVLLINRCPLVPHYLRDPARPATDVEIVAMERIRERLFDAYPHTRDLLRPTRIATVAQLPADPGLAEAYQGAFRQRLLGDPYERLARLCKHLRLTDMELCIHHGDKAHAVLDRQVVESVSRGGYRTWRMDPRSRHTREHALFGNFSFPLFDRNKVQMAGIARKRGWNAIMQLTWFCHEPTRDMQPCGRCASCLHTIEEGLGWRIPFENRMTSALYRTFVQPTGGLASK